MLQKNILIFALTLTFIFANSLQAQLLEVENMFLISGGAFKKSDVDIAAKCSLVQKDQMLELTITVKDDDIVSDKSKKNMDKVELYFAAYHINFTDYVYGVNNGNQRLFRQSEEPSSLVDLKGFIKNADYPEKSISKEYPLPSPGKLENKFIPIGMVGYELVASKGVAPKMLLRNDYAPFEKKVLNEIGDLDKLISYSFELIEGGYEMKINIDKHALGFFNIPFTKGFKILVDVFDTDSEHSDNYTLLSSHKSREKNRPFYFNEVKLDVPFIFSLKDVDDAALNKTNIIINGWMTKRGVAAYGQLVQNIIYDKNIFSEADLLEFHFHPEYYTYSKEQIGKFEYEKISYKGVHNRPFAENEIMFIYDGTVQSSKYFAYDRNKTSNFVNQMAVLPNGFPGFALYDYEPEEYNGWSSCGICSDEVVALYSLREPMKIKQMFVLGAKLRRNQEVYIDKEKFEQVKDFDINWIYSGKSFSVKIIFLPEAKKSNLEIIYDIDEQLNVKKRL